MITEDIKEKNFSLYIKKLNQLGVETERLVALYGDKIKEATFTNSNEFGNAYNGSFLEITLKVLTPFAVKLNDLLNENNRVNKESLVKVCLLHQISKVIKLIPNDNQWEVEKKGLLYKYDNTLPSIRTGLHSLNICSNCGITFSDDEAEAMTVNDRTATDEQAKWFSSVMATIIRQANELTYLQLNNKK